MQLDYVQQNRFFQRFSTKVTDELNTTRTKIIDSVQQVEELVETIEKTSSRILGISCDDKKLVIDSVATVLRTMENYEESVPIYYYDMQSVYRFINLYTAEISKLQEKQYELEEQVSAQLKSSKRTALDEFTRLAKSEELEVTRKQVKNYSLFLESMKTFIDESDAKDLIKVKIQLLSLKDKICRLLLIDIRSDNYYKVFHFFHKENISMKYHQYSNRLSSVVLFSRMATITLLFSFSYYTLLYIN